MTALCYVNLGKQETILIERNDKLPPIAADTSLTDFCENIVGDIVRKEKQEEFRTLFDIACIKEKFEKGIGTIGFLYVRHRL